MTLFGQPIWVILIALLGAAIIGSWAVDDKMSLVTFILIAVVWIMAFAVAALWLYGALMSRI